MSKVPSLPYIQVVVALERDGWVVVRQRGSHIRLEKKLLEETSIECCIASHRSCSTFSTLE